MLTLDQMMIFARKSGELIAMITGGKAVLTAAVARRMDRFGHMHTCDRLRLRLPVTSADSQRAEHYKQPAASSRALAERCSCSLH